MTYTTIMQKFMLLSHSELLFVKYARIAWTIVRWHSRAQHSRHAHNNVSVLYTYTLWLSISKEDMC